MPVFSLQIHVRCIDSPLFVFRQHGTDDNCCEKAIIYIPFVDHNVDAGVFRISEQVSFVAKLPFNTKCNKE